MKTRLRSLTIGSALGCVAVALAIPAMAQESKGSSDLDVVVVTANKRSEDINKVGLTITAMSGAKLAERKVTSLEDIASIVPGLTYTPSTTNTPIFTLRGVGFNESSLGVYPAVSVYIDQAPLPFPVIASHAAFDLERVEVLKGPQGTLFGQNSTGGAINYIAAKPTKSFAAGMDIGIGRFNQVDGNAYVSGPINENLGFRFAVSALNADGWQESYTRRDTNGKQAYLAGRFLLDWKASDVASFSLNLNGWKDTSQPQAQQLIATHQQVGGNTSNPARDFYSPPTNGASSGQLGYPFSPFEPRAADWSSLRLDPQTSVTDPDSGASTLSTAGYTNYAPYGDRKFLQIAVRADFNLPHDLTLTSQTSFDDYKQNQGTDGDGMALVAYDLQQGYGFIRSFNQELRIANAATAQFRWLLGANYEDSKTFEDQLLRYYANSNYNPGTLFINSSGVTNRQKITNYAMFGSTEYGVTDQLTLKASARYTHSDIGTELCSYTLSNGNVNKLFNALGRANFGGLNPPPAFTDIAPADCYTLNTQFVPGQPFIDNLKENNVSWRVGADYQVTGDTLLYLNGSRGYKAGSYPSLAAASYGALHAVTQESVTAIEAGVKTQFADRRVALNAAAFYYDYKDKQVRGKILDSPNIFGTLDALVNVPKSTITGAEADISFRPTDGLTLTAAVTYLKSKIKEYRGYDIFGGSDNAIPGTSQDPITATDPRGIANPAIVGTESFSGDVLPYTPKFSGVLDIDYRMKLGTRGTPFFGITANTKSKQDAAIGGSHTTLAVGPTFRIAPGVGLYPYTIDSYTTVDARLGYEGENGKYKVMLWGKNIFDKYYWTAVIPSSDSSSRFAGKPATYGLSFSYKFE
jgi:iron complex outermembrane recepter protein